VDLRIGGIASGLDTQQIIKDLMQAERTKVDKLEQNKMLLEWKQEMYNDLNKELANFILDSKKEFGLSKTTSTGLYVNSSVSGLDWVRKATVSDSSIASISARADAVEGSYNVHVESLASNANVASNQSLGELGVLKQQFTLNDSDVIKFTIHRIENNQETVSQTFEFSGDDLSNLTIQDIANQINSYRDAVGKDLGVKAVYDASINRFFLQSTTTGESNGFKVTEDTGVENVINFMTGIDGDNSPTNIVGLKLESGIANKGTDAIIDFGGASGIHQSSNQFTINGINFDLKAKGDTTVQVATDIDGVYEKISNFVTKYNELISKFSETLGEKRYRDYLPLTKEQKDSMSEKEIELWEEKAKSGLIKEDKIIAQTLQTIRSGFYDKVEGVTGIFDQLTQIGISTESYFNANGGQLVINESKLKTAIRDNVDGVLDLLFKEPEGDLKSKTESSMTASELKEKRSQSGLIRRLFDNMVVGMKDIVSKAGAGSNADLYRNVNSSIMIDFVTNYGSISILDKDANGLNKRIAQMNDYLIRTEDRYWKQFTAMETALQRMNSQSSWLMQQFGGGE